MLENPIGTFALVTALCVASAGAQAFDESPDLLRYFK
jgi:hypothetical protein